MKRSSLPTTYARTHGKAATCTITDGWVTAAQTHTMTNTPHRYAATDITVDRSRLHPRHIFRIDDRIQVHGTQTRHHGRIARIQGIGDRRLTVDFEDGLSGRYVEYNDAVVIPERGSPTATVFTPTRLQNHQGRASNVQVNRPSRPIYQTPPHETSAPTTPDVSRYHRTFGRHVPRTTRAASEAAMDREWNRLADLDAADNPGGIEPDLDDEYSILEHDDGSAEEQPILPQASNLTATIVLDQFSITAATLITQYGNTEDEMEYLIQTFTRQVRLDVNTLSSASRQT